MQPANTQQLGMKIDGLEAVMPVFLDELLELDGILRVAPQGPKSACGIKLLNEF
jgi:hypothetical protein